MQDVHISMSIQVISGKIVKALSKLFSDSKWRPNIFVGLVPNF